MAEASPIIYHFEEDSNTDALRHKSENLFRVGWRKAGAPRQIEMKFPDGRRRMHYSQAFSKPALPAPESGEIWRCLDARCTKGHRPYWGEIGSGEHLLQIYRDESALLDSLERFVMAGLGDGQSVAIISTPTHRAEMERRLTARGIDVAGARRVDSYIDLDAEETLARFMRNGLPDEALFRETIRSVLSRARQGDRRVRAFGEMVALLWAQGNRAATLLLEHYWHVLCQLEDIPLFCAYPWNGFGPEDAEAVRDIFSAHSRLVG
jgi:hypothetical protein